MSIVEIPQHCPVCGERAGIVGDEPLMPYETESGQHANMWMKCHLGHKFTVAFDVPEGVDIGLIIPGLSPQMKMNR